MSTHTRDGFLVAGGGTFGTLYLLNVLAASLTQVSNARALYVPVAGPLIYSASVKGRSAEMDVLFLIADAMIRAGGIAMMVIGLHDETELVRNDRARIHVAPILTPTQTGVGLVGVF